MLCEAEPSSLAKAEAKTRGVNEPLLIQILKITPQHVKMKQ